MASIGKVDVVFEVKSEADKFWKSFRDSTTLYLKVLPEHYKSIELLQGDWKSVGSVRLLKFAEGSPLSFLKEKIEAVDDENRTGTFTFIEGDLLKYYKKFKILITVTPKEDGGSLVNCSLEFEKASEEIPDPKHIGDFTIMTFQNLDAYILKP